MCPVKTGTELMGTMDELYTIAVRVFIGHVSFSATWTINALCWHRGRILPITSVVVTKHGICSQHRGGRKRQFAIRFLNANYSTRYICTPFVFSQSESPLALSSSLTFATAACSGNRHIGIALPYGST